MKINKVLLIKPIYYHSHYNNMDMPAGLGYISEALIRAGIENIVVDMRLVSTIEKLTKIIKEFNPGLIGVSLMSFGYKYHYKLLKEIKDVFKDIKIAVGGPHLSTLRESVLKDCKEIDYGITLEGDETIVELCRAEVPVDKMKGLLYRDSNGNIQYNGDREFIKDLDTIGFPTYSGFELNKYYKFINIVTSRGCPYHCIYCPVNLTIGKKFRVRSAKSVVDELRYWYEKGFREFGIADDNFSLVRKRVVDICDEIERQGLTGLKISCGNGLRADKVDRPLLARMKEVGFCYIAFGVEGGNDKVLEKLQKSEKIETIERAIKDACDLGYRVTLFFLLGSPGETKADIRDSVRLAKKYPVYDVRFYNLIPFQNTKLYEWVSHNNYFRKDPVQFIGEASHWVNDPIFETPELSLDERRRLYKWANRKVQLHTLHAKREVYKESTTDAFGHMGIPLSIAKYLSWIYWSYPFYAYFRQTVIKDWSKNLFKSFFHRASRVKGVQG